MRTRMFVLLVYALLMSCPAWADPDEAVRIVAPPPETTIYDNGGNVGVDVSFSGPIGGGIVVNLLLDGTVIASGAQFHFDLTDIDRGAHVLVAQVTAADGTVLAASEGVTFYMWRASALFPNRH